MSVAATMPLQERQRRLLAFMGIDVYVRRDMPDSVRTAPEPAAVAIRRTTAAGAGLRLTVRLEGAASPLLARHGRLLDHLIAACGVDRASARIDSGGTAPAELPLLCLGAAPGDHPRAVLAPPLAALAVSGQAKAGLWRELRRLRASRGGA